jgi:hypothetical protein
METNPAGTVSAGLVIAGWAGSGIRSRRVAAVLALELLGKPRNTRVDSSMKIAVRFGTDNSMAVRARLLLTGARIIYRSDADHHYYVA